MDKPIKLPPLPSAGGNYIVEWNEVGMRAYATLAVEQATAELRAELQSVLDDWNALVKASGSPTNGGAIGHVKALRAECDALQADAERYRFVRDADRSDCITRELSLYAMESLDEYVDAAMEDAARAALKEAK